MTRVVLLTAVMFGGAIAVIRRLPAEQREDIARLPAVVMGWMMEHMPDECPPKIMMSGVRRIQEQNEQLLALLRERLPVEESASVESPSPAPKRRRTRGVSRASSD